MGADAAHGRGDVGAFLASFRADLVALAYVLTGSQHDAQDVVHTVIVRLLRTDLTRVGDPRAYCRRAVINECASWGRRRVRSARTVKALEAEWNRVLSSQPDPFGRVEVMSALRSLSQRQRTAVVLRYYLDWNDDQIAEALKCAPATVRSLLSRGLKRLRAELEGEDRR